MKKLIIAEKPKVSMKIARSISENYSRRGSKGAYYYEVKVNGDHVIVASAVGHLYTLVQEGSRWEYPVFDVRWAPLHIVDSSKSYLKKYVNLLQELCRDAEVFYIATDYDLEGELLGYNALRFACRPGDKVVLRMKFSTLTQRDLREAFQNPIKIDEKMVEAAEARHKMDWFWGINVSRALSLAGRVVKKKFNTLSAGRVQTPALAILVAREREIKDFKSKPFWEVLADLDVKGEKITAHYIGGRVFEEDKAKKIIKNSRSDEAELKSLEKKKSKKLPLVPFDLGGLQSEAYRVFGYNPKRTQDMAQSLYESGYISYPRTSSQKLPYTIGFKSILLNLRNNREFQPTVDMILSREKLRPIQGKKDDPAHPAIYPTGVLPEKISPAEEKLYKLIVYRFIAAFGDPLIQECTRGVCEIGLEKYVFEGSRIIDAGWTKLYPYVKIGEKTLPELKVGDYLKVLKVYSKKGETKPPPMYNPASLIRELESRGLGTKATRAEIVDTLYKRGYIRGRNTIRVTELGYSVIEALQEYVPAIISEELTRKFEEKLENIRAGKESQEHVLEEAKRELTRILNEFKMKEKLVGEKLVKAMEEKEKREGSVGTCPNCGSPLKIIRSRKTKKIFIGCSNYPRCSTSFPLPQKTGIRTTDKKCKYCGLPMVSIPMGKRRLLSCIDMKCESKTKFKKN